MSFCAASTGRTPEIPDQAPMSVGFFVDYESPLAKKVAGAVWSGLSRAALDSGNTRISASWASIVQENPTSARTDVRIFAVGQDRPDSIDAIPPFAVSPEAEEPVLYGVIVASSPRSPNPLVGPLLYQGVERLKVRGVRASLVEPAVLRGVPEECDLYAKKILDRIE